MQDAFYVTLDEDGGGLHMDGKPAPAQEKGSEGEIHGDRGEAAHGGGTAAELENAGEQGAGKVQLKREESGQFPTQKRKKAAGIEHPGEDGEEDDKAADGEQRVERLPHGLGQGGGEAELLEQEGLRVIMA